jgi:hypothetical protein
MGLRLRAFKVQFMPSPCRQLDFSGAVVENSEMPSGAGISRGKFGEQECALRLLSAGESSSPLSLLRCQLQ